MWKFITREVSPRIADCQLTYRRREPVNYERAAGQHAEYCALLRHRGAEVLTLPACEEFPDCCFVEDAGVLLDEILIVPRMGAASRRGETREVEKLFARTREVARMCAPATLDGGDVLLDTASRRLFVGLSRRTNAAGVEALANFTRPFGYRVTPIEVMGSLHLTTACSLIDEETVILNSHWVDERPFAGMRILRAFEDEPWAANTLRAGAAVCVEAGAPRTAELVSRQHPDIEVLDISEFRKAEGSLTCLSLIYRDAQQRAAPPDRKGN